MLEIITVSLLTMAAIFLMAFAHFLVFEGDDE